MKRLKEEVELRKLVKTGYNPVLDRQRIDAITAFGKAVREGCAKVANQDEGYIIKENGERACEDCGNAIAAAIRERGK